MADSAAIARRNRTEIARRETAPRTEYVLRLTPERESQYTPYQQAPAGAEYTSKPSRARNVAVKYDAKQNNSNKFTEFFTHPHLITGAWMVAVAAVSADEWKKNHIFPRPARLWWTSMTFAILGLLAMAESLSPLAGALAVGYAIAVLWQYYNGTGQFGTTGTLV